MKSVSKEIWNQINYSAVDSTVAYVWDQIWDHVKIQISERIRNNGWDEVTDRVVERIRNQVVTQVWHHFEKPR